METNAFKTIEFCELVIIKKRLMERGRKSKIPKVIHFIIGPNTTPLIDKCVHSWRVLKNSGFEIRIWNDDLIAKFLISYHGFAYDAFCNARNHGEAADIARYLIIHTYGGYYVDWDIELLDVSGFLKLGETYSEGYMIVDPANGTLASEYFCSTPNDKFLINLTSDIVNLYNTGKRNYMFTPQYSGPYRMRDSLLLHKETVMVSVPIKEVFAYDYTEIRNPPDGTITQPLIHYWVHSWINNT